MNFALLFRQQTPLECGTFYWYTLSQA